MKGFDELDAELCEAEADVDAILQFGDEADRALDGPPALEISMSLLQLLTASIQHDLDGLRI